VRLGCGGCLTTVVVLGVIAGAMVWVIWLTTGILAVPNLPEVATGDEGRAAQKLAQITRSGRGRSPRQTMETVSLTEGELNALLGRRLAGLAELPLSRVQLRLPGGGQAELAGQIPLAALLTERPVSHLASLVPAGWQRTPIWLRFRLRARLDPTDEGRRRYLRLDIERFWVGQRRLPSLLPRLMLSPATLSVLHFRLPDTVRDVVIEVGRVDVTTAASP
jgi:hypothetical protein